MNKSSEKGSGTIEIIMGIVIIVLIGALIYFYIQAQKQNGVASQSPSPSASATPQSTPSESTVKSSVNSFYSDYLTAFTHTNDPKYPGMNSDEAGMKAAVARYGTTKFTTFYNNFTYAYDPVFCAQNYPVAAPTISKVTIESDKATVIISEDFGSSTTSLTVNMVGQNDPKIDSITCPTRQ